MGIGWWNEVGGEEVGGDGWQRRNRIESEGWKKLQKKKEKKDFFVEVSVFSFFSSLKLASETNRVIIFFCSFWLLLLCFIQTLMFAFLFFFFFFCFSFIFFSSLKVVSVQKMK